MSLQVSPDAYALCLYMFDRGARCYCYEVTTRDKEFEQMEDNEV